MVCVFVFVPKYCEGEITILDRIVSMPTGINCHLAKLPIEQHTFQLLFEAEEAFLALRRLDMD